ncbi:MAG: DUF3857 domain-containing protein [Bacteroidetes bacterium]|nr:DUF3857 domain-containing protein [Bacteroidota bacterium]
MKLFWSLCILLILSFTAGAQRVPIRKTPVWVKPVTFSKEVTDTTNTSGGYFDLLVDAQSNLLTKESYRHYAQKILTEKGLENNSSISQTYDPAYETLTFHTILIHRGNQTMDKLKDGKFEVLRREENMERLMYDGSLTAVFNLLDLRVGDVIEYSFSVKGWNPVFGDKFTGSFYLNYSVPVGVNYHRLIARESNPLTISYLNQVPSPTVVVAGDTKEYVWRVENTPPLHYEDGTPDWHEPYNRIDVSNFKSWGEVVDWATALYDPSFVSNTSLDAKIEQFKKEKNEDERVNQCIRFVQDEIRYLAFSDGIHGFRPNEAYKVFDRRYGDCKDKSILLCYILKRLGVESYPALVHTSRGLALPKVSASPYRFDHCIATFIHKDSTYWVDPTISLQRGALKERYTPNYKNALVIKKANAGLTAIPDYDGVSSIDVAEVFDVGVVGTSATLSVRTTYRGDEANSMRDQFKGGSMETITKNYLNFYASDYPEIKSLKQIKTEDDEKENVFITLEEYSIDPFWKYDSTNNKYTVQTYPRNLTSYLVKPTTKIRSMPFRLTYPQNITHRIKLNMPEKWSVEEGGKTIESKGLIFNRTYSLSDNDKTINLNYSFRTKKEFLEPNEIKEHTQKIDEIYNQLTFDISYSKGLSRTDTSVNKAYVVIGLIAVGLCVLGLRKLNEYDPEPKPAEVQYDQIGGWLIVVALILFFNPIRMAIDFSNGSYFQHFQWRILTDQSYGSYNPKLGMYVMVEFVVNIMLLCYSVFLCSIFITRRSSFPTFMVIYLLANLSIRFLDVVVASSMGLLEMNSKTSSMVLGSLMSAVIWVPYFLKSERVKGTFINRY